MCVYFSRRDICYYWLLCSFNQKDLFGIFFRDPIKFKERLNQEKLHIIEFVVVYIRASFGFGFFFLVTLIGKSCVNQAIAAARALCVCLIYSARCSPQTSRGLSRTWIFLLSCFFFYYMIYNASESMTRRIPQAKEYTTHRDFFRERKTFPRDKNHPIRTT